MAQNWNVSCTRYAHKDSFKLKAQMCATIFWTQGSLPSIIWPAHAPLLCFWQGVRWIWPRPWALQYIMHISARPDSPHVYLRSRISKFSSSETKFTLRMLPWVMLWSPACMNGRLQKYWHAWHRVSQKWTTFALIVCECGPSWCSCILRNSSWIKEWTW